MSPTQREDLDHGRRIGPLRPSTTCTNSGATTARPTSDGNRDHADEPRGPNPDISDQFAVTVHLRECGKNTCCSGAAMRENGTRMTLVASAYVPTDAAPEETTDHDAADVTAGLIENVLPEDVARKAAQSARLAMEKLTLGRHGVRYQRERSRCRPPPTADRRSPMRRSRSPRARCPSRRQRRLRRFDGARGGGSASRARGVECVAPRAVTKNPDPEHGE